MNVLIAGSRGFLGAHLFDFFERRGYRVTGLDIGVDGQPDQVKADLLQSDQIEDLLGGIDCVVNMAGIGDVYLAHRDPLGCVAANVSASINLALRASRMGVHVVQASTWEVYGTSATGSVDELSRCAPSNHYAMTKYAAEVHMRLLLENRLSVLRLGTAYGPNMRQNTVLASFISRAMKGEDLIIHGSGSQTRQFVHTQDVCSAFDAAARLQLPGIFNVCPSESTSILDLAHKVSSEYAVGIRFAPTNVHEPSSVVVSSMRARRELGWNPKVSLADGIRLYNEWVALQNS